MGWPDDVRNRALVSAGRCCAICHQFCGLKIELHHIVPKAEGGDDSFDNCLPLCLDCHADMRSYDHRHPKGNKYTTEELKAHRNRWFDKVDKSIGVGAISEHIDLDQATFLRLMTILPWDGSIGFVRDRYFEGSFRVEKLEDFDRFEYECRDPAFDFLDADLEALRVLLLKGVNRLLTLVCRETFPVPGSECNSVPPEWEEEQSDRYREAISNLNIAGDDVCSVYDRLVALGRRKLGVQPPPK